MSLHSAASATVSTSQMSLLPTVDDFVLPLVGFAANAIDTGEMVYCGAHISASSVIRPTVAGEECKTYQRWLSLPMLASEPARPLVITKLHLMVHLPASKNHDFCCLRSGVAPTRQQQRDNARSFGSMPHLAAV